MRRINGIVNFSFVSQRAMARSTTGKGLNRN